MRTISPALASLLIIGLASPVTAGDLRQSVAQAVQQGTPSDGASTSKAIIVPAAALVVGGFATAIYSFTHQEHREESDYHPNPNIGVAGLGAAGAGAFILWMSRRHPAAPSIEFGPRSLTITKQVKW